MRCPACNAVNPREAVRCAACEASLRRRPARRRASEEPDAAAAARTGESNRAALRAYHLSLFGLIPLVGLVLGPAAVVFGALAGWKSRTDPAFTARAPLIVAVALGLIDTLTNWAGVTLMLLGLLSVRSP